MHGIIVGVDGSGDSQRALEWAMKEAAVRATPLTVMTVHEQAHGYLGGMNEFSNDHILGEKARQIVQAEVDSAANALGDSAPASVTVQVTSGSVAEELVNAAKDADMLVV